MRDTVCRGQVSISLITDIHFLRYFWRQWWMYNAVGFSFLEQLIHVKLKLFSRDALSYRSYTISNTHTLREILVSIFPNIINLPWSQSFPILLTFLRSIQILMFSTAKIFIWYSLFMFYMLAHSLVAILQSMFFITCS
jgi:hypothetical protein